MYVLWNPTVRKWSEPDEFAVTDEYRKVTLVQGRKLAKTMIRRAGVTAAWDWLTEGGAVQAATLHEVEASSLTWGSALAIGCESVWAEAFFSQNKRKTFVRSGHGFLHDWPRKMDAYAQNHRGRILQIRSNGSRCPNSCSHTAIQAIAVCTSDLAATGVIPSTSPFMSPKEWWAILEAEERYGAIVTSTC